MMPAVGLNAQVTTGSVNGRVQDPTSGRFLNNAKVSVVGSTITTQTDEYGEYQLNGLPAGVAKIKAFYSGLGEQEIAVNIQAGKTVTQDIVFDEKAAGESSVVLDTFTVASHRNTDVASIAVNEQRFSPNIKTVIETDAFGDIAEGNIGEFLKFLPGVTVDYGFHEYYDDRVTFDVNAAYAFSKRIELFANVRNLFNKPQDLQRYNDTSPGYSNLYRREKFGAQITIGVKGTF